MDRDDRVICHFDDFRDMFCSCANVTVLKQKIIGRNGVFHPLHQYEDYLHGHQKYIPKLTKRMDYDCIICDSPLLWLFEDWTTIHIPTLSIIEDQHGIIPKHCVDHAIKHNHTIIHKYQFNKFHKNIPSHINTFWLPHSVNTNIYKDRNLPKEYGVLLSGSMYKIYHTRNKALDSLKGESFFRHLRRPVDYAKTQWPIKDDYSKELNKSWLSICCGADVEYPVMKYYEIPASKSVLYSDYFSELGDLGFIPDENMIVLDKNNIKEQIIELLKDKTKLKRIALSGFDLIHHRHTDDIRSNELISYIKGIV